MGGWNVMLLICCGD